jgi:hypothetical protein
VNSGLASTSIFTASGVSELEAEAVPHELEVFVSMHIVPLPTIVDESQFPILT